MKEKTKTITVKISEKTHKKARFYELNMWKIARNAIKKEVEKEVVLHE